MQSNEVFQRYQQLQAYVGWTQEDADRVRAAAAAIEPAFNALIEDFYAAIEREPKALKVITGGQAQIDRLKQTLRGWLEDFFSGTYDHAYVTRRWRVGHRHVEIGLDQVYTNVALSRLRSRLLAALRDQFADSPADAFATEQSVIKLLDLDLAVIEDAYQTEYANRQQRIERMAAIGQVSAGIAHELRNPLNVIKTSVYYLQNARNASLEKTTNHLNRIDRQVGMADDVITALSDFAKLPLPDFRAVEVEPLLREVVEAAELPDAIVVSIDCPAATPPMSADSRQLRIVISNLIRNARDAMPDGGRLQLAVRQAGDRVEIATIDTGVGIQAEDLQRILEPLYSTKSRGIGLGLAIAWSILDKHHAKLSIESTPGRGSTFTISLPCAVQEP